jgi:hypothetical protein
MVLGITKNIPCMKYKNATKDFWYFVGWLFIIVFKLSIKPIIIINF